MPATSITVSHSGDHDYPYMVMLDVQGNSRKELFQSYALAKRFAWYASKNQGQVTVRDMIAGDTPTRQNLKKALQDAVSAVPNQQLSYAS